MLPPGPLAAAAWRPVRRGERQYISALPPRNRPPREIRRARMHYSFSGGRVTGASAGNREETRRPGVSAGQRLRREEAMNDKDALHRREIMKLFGATALAGLAPSGAGAQGKTVRLGVL